MPQANRAFLEGMNKITFTNEDIKVRHLDHRRPLYLVATINQIFIKRVLVDIIAFVNLIPLNTLEVVPKSKILEFPMEVIGFGGTSWHTVGYIQL